MKNGKRVTPGVILRFAIIITLIFSLLSFFITKIVYDSVFARWDSPTDSRDEETFSGEKHCFVADGGIELCGRLFRAADIGGDCGDAAAPTDADGDATLNRSNGGDALPNKSDAGKNGGAAQSLVIIAPGFHAVGSDYVSVAYELCSHGRDVFIFDPAGSGESGGDSCFGFARELFDLNAAVEYTKESFSYSDVFLLGHSRGAWAVCCALKYFEDYISGAAAVSAINSPMEGIMLPAYEKAGGIVYLNYPMLLLYQTVLFGADHANESAAGAVRGTEVPVLVIHAENDTLVPSDSFSLYSHRSEAERDGVEFYRCVDPDGDGHTGILYGANGSADAAVFEKIESFFSDAERQKTENTERTDIGQDKDGRDRTDAGVYAG